MKKNDTRSIRCRMDSPFGLHEPYVMTLRPGYTALVGPNGAGKTTALRQLASIAAERDYRVLRYQNLTDGGDTAMSVRLMSGDMKNLVRGAMGSEGENILYNFGDVVERIGKLIREMKSGLDSPSCAFVLLDGIDSGTSIDKQEAIMELFREIERDVREGRLPVFVINAVNDYALTGQTCIDVRTGKRVSFGSYDDYARFIRDYFTDGKEKPT